MEVVIKKQRSLGIELFRVVAMFLIVLLHVLGHGGVYPNAAYMSANYKIAWYLETLGYCAVNCYALISGYVGIGTKFKFRRIVHLWLEVFFITTSTTVLFSLFVPGSVTADQWLIALFPLTRREYWYFNAYVILFPFLPILNEGITRLGKRLHGRLMLYLFVITAILPILGDRDLFSLSWGYSGLWLAVMYVFGAYYRLYGIPKLPRPVLLGIFFGAGGVAWGAKIGIQALVMKGRLSSESMLAERAGDLIEYTSPFMVIMAIALLWFFAELPIKGGVTAFAVKWLGKSSFGVFLVHVGTMVWGAMGNAFVPLASLSPLGMTASVLLVCTVFYLGCSAYSLARLGLFRVCRIDRAVEWAADKYFSKPLENMSEK